VSGDAPEPPTSGWKGGREQPSTRPPKSPLQGNSLLRETPIHFWRAKPVSPPLTSGRCPDPSPNGRNNTPSFCRFPPDFWHAPPEEACIVADRSSLVASPTGKGPPFRFVRGHGASGARRVSPSPTASLPRQGAKGSKSRARMTPSHDSTPKTLHKARMARQPRLATQPPTPPAK